MTVSKYTILTLVDQRGQFVYNYRYHYRGLHKAVRINTILTLGMSSHFDVPLDTKIVVWQSEHQR